jgi:hypothetical protein
MASSIICKVVCPFTEGKGYKIEGFEHGNRIGAMRQKPRHSAERACEAANAV